MTVRFRNLLGIVSWFEGHDTRVHTFRKTSATTIPKSPCCFGVMHASGASTFASAQTGFEQAAILALTLSIVIEIRALKVIIEA
jgi:hypothetical protein